MWSNFRTNTCDKIPELGQKCLLDRPDSLPAVQSQKGVEFGDETTIRDDIYKPLLCEFSLIILPFVEFINNYINY